jgi:hypothetical protein
MDTALIAIIVSGSVILVVLVIFLIARWYAEKKRQKALVHQDLVEKSFTSASQRVCR